MKNNRLRKKGFQIRDRIKRIRERLRTPVDSFLLLFPINRHPEGGRAKARRKEKPWIQLSSLDPNRSLFFFSYNNSSCPHPNIDLVIISKTSNKCLFPSRSLLGASSAFLPTHSRQIEKREIIKICGEGEPKVFVVTPHKAKLNCHIFLL